MFSASGSSILAMSENMELPVVVNGPGIGIRPVSGEGCMTLASNLSWVTYLLCEAVA